MLVKISNNAQFDLAQIRDYTLARHGAQQADAYSEFLLVGISELATDHAHGRPVPEFLDLRRIVLKWPKSRSSHIVIYAIDEAEQSVEILQVYHSRLNVAQRLEEGMLGDRPR